MEPETETQRQHRRWIQEVRDSLFTLAERGDIKARTILFRNSSPEEQEELLELWGIPEDADILGAPVY